MEHPYIVRAIATMPEAYTIETPIDDAIDCDPAYDEQCLWKDTIGEFAGTALFVYIGLSSIQQTMLTAGSSLGVPLCFAFGLTAGIVVSGKSGGHLNPAVSLTVFLMDAGFGVKRLIMYTCAQLCGGALAAMVVMATYYSFINNYKHKEVFAGTFGTVKSPHVSLASSIIDQFVGSALLMMAIVMIPNHKYKPIAVGGVLGALGMFQGVNGFAFNLARDLGPRIVSWWAIGSIAFSAGGTWFWVPMLVPFLAMPVGCMLAGALCRLPMDY